jgi:hypothetical protein
MKGREVEDREEDEELGNTDDDEEEEEEEEEDDEEDDEEGTEDEAEDDEEEEGRTMAGSKPKPNKDFKFCLKIFSSKKPFSQRSRSFCVSREKE